MSESVKRGASWAWCATQSFVFVSLHKSLFISSKHPAFLPGYPLRCYLDVAAFFAAWNHLARNEVLLIRQHQQRAKAAGSPVAAFKLDSESCRLCVCVRGCVHPQKLWTKKRQKLILNFFMQQFSLTHKAPVMANLKCSPSLTIFCAFYCRHKVDIKLSIATTTRM